MAYTTAAEGECTCGYGRGAAASDVTWQFTAIPDKPPTIALGQGAGRPGARGVAALSKCDPARLRSNVSWWRPDCLAGHVGLELRNVVANYAFEKSRRFAGNQPNSGHGGHSRL